MIEPLKEFTTVVPVWRPYVTPVDQNAASAEQRETFKETPSNRKVSDYHLVLAHDPETLALRTPLFNGIMYSRGGLSRAETELGAVAASVVNRCIYCTAVHASRYNELTKDETVIQKVFQSGEDADVTPRLKAIMGFATRLSQCPSEATKADVERLVQEGLSMEEILDLVLSASLFGWANRLMHTLGQPMPQPE
ncbi:MAG: peroxidase-related enzyme [Chloroflexi bacterium]|nr:peroxidase-related enzyme [Chloroflexota bacterium]MDA1229033.1 peroxidase-related enzyme [Chloroflexota bacterium]